MANIATCIKIFFARILDVSLNTIRTTFVIKGKTFTVTIAATADTNVIGLKANLDYDKTKGCVRSLENPNVVIGYVNYGNVLESVNGGLPWGNVVSVWNGKQTEIFMIAFSGDQYTNDRTIYTGNDLYTYGDIYTFKGDKTESKPEFTIFNNNQYLGF